MKGCNELLHFGRENIDFLTTKFLPVTDEIPGSDFKKTYEVSPPVYGPLRMLLQKTLELIR